MYKKVLITCGATDLDQAFLEHSFNKDWLLAYIHDLDSLESVLEKGIVNLVLVKLEKGNILSIINSKAKIQKIQRKFSVPICFIVQYDNPYFESNYQILIVNDTEIITVNSKSIEKVASRVVAGHNRIYRKIYEESFYQLDGRSYNLAM